MAASRWRQEQKGYQQPGSYDITTGVSLVILIIVVGLAIVAVRGIMSLF